MSEPSDKAALAVGALDGRLAGHPVSDKQKVRVAFAVALEPEACYSVSVGGLLPPEPPIARMSP